MLILRCDVEIEFHFPCWGQGSRVVPRQTFLHPVIIVIECHAVILFMLLGQIRVPRGYGQRPIQTALGQKSAKG